jgi:hypothetical protein
MSDAHTRPAPPTTRPLQAEPGAPRSASWASSLLVVAGVAAAVGAYYLSIYVRRHLNVPLGWDTSRYIWITTVGRAYGMGNVMQVVPNAVAAVQTNPGRPGFPVMAAMLSSLGRTSPFRVAAILPVAMAISIGLASGALVTYVRRTRTWELALVALVVSTSALVVRLMRPETYQDNLLAAAVLLAGLLAVVAAVWDRRALLPGMLILGAGGLIHWAFFLVLAGVVALTAVAYAPASWRAWREGRERALATPSARLLEAVAGAGAFGAAMIFGVLGVVPREPHLSQSEFMAKLHRDLPKYRLPITVPVAALGAVSLGVARPGDPVRQRRSRLLLILLLVWALVTAVAVAAIEVLHLRVPAHRFLAFDLALPILGVIGVLWAAELVAGWRRLPRAAAAAIGAAIVAGALLVSATLSYHVWFTTQPWMDASKVNHAAAAARYLDDAHVSPERPIVFLVDTHSNRSYTSLIGHMIRAGLPAQRIRHAFVYLGTPRAYLAGTPTQFPGNPKMTSLSAGYFATLRATYAQDPVAVISSTVNSGYAAWVAAHPGSVVAPGVAVVRGPLPVAPATSIPSIIGSFGPLGLLWLSAITMVLLVGTGLGWTLGLLGQVLRRQEIVAVSPAVGVAALVVAGVVADRLGVRLTGAGGALVPLCAAAAGWLLFGIRSRSRRDRTDVPELPAPAMDSAGTR